MNLTYVLLPILVLAGLPAQPAPPASPEARQPALLEWRGQYGGEEAAGAQVVLDAHRWSRLWGSLGRQAPPLDFTRYVAVVAYGGRRLTGGYTLAFLEPVADGDDVLIRWRILPPAPDAYTTQAIARPWAIRAFPRPKGRVILEPVPTLLEPTEWGRDPG